MVNALVHPGRHGGRPYALLAVHLVEQWSS